LGLFIGSHGIKRTFFLIVTDNRKEKESKTVENPSLIVTDNRKEKKSKTVEILSDLKGVIYASIAITDDETVNQNEIERECIKIRNEIQRMEMNYNSISLLPSTPLAIGYFENFILQVAPELSSIKKLKIANKSKKFYDLDKNTFKLYIVLPDEFTNADHNEYAALVNKNKLEEVIIEKNGDKNKKRQGRIFSFFADPLVKKGQIKLYDFATTLLSVNKAIEIVYPRSDDTDAVEIDSIRKKEIRNFEKVLQYLLKEKASSYKDYIEITYANLLKKQS
jgi:Prokaryotic STING domain